MQPFRASTNCKAFPSIHRLKLYPHHSFHFNHTIKQNYGSISLTGLTHAPKGFIKKRRRGRGPNNTVGCGHKGSKVRQGNRRQSHRGYEGGSTPLQVKVPRIKWHKYDHNNALNWIDLEQVALWIERGALNKKKVITMYDLVKSRCFNCESSPKLHLKYGLALINNSKEYSDFPYKINIEVTFVTPSAKQAIENKGGIVRLKHYKMKNLRQFVYPEHYEFVPKHNLDTLPKPRWRHFFPDYPQLPIKDELQYLGKYQVHPELLPKNIENQEELMEQEWKMKLGKKKYPKPLFRRPTDHKTKLFAWAKPK